MKRAVLAAKTLSYSTGPSGVYLEKMFERWGILEQIRSRIVVPPPGVPVGSLVAKGTAELGFQQLSELMNLEGITVLGPLPPAIQTITTFSGGVSANCAPPTRRVRCSTTWHRPPHRPSSSSTAWKPRSSEYRAGPKGLYQGRVTLQTGSFEGVSWQTPSDTRMSRARSCLTACAISGSPECSGCTWFPIR